MMTVMTTVFSKLVGEGEEGEGGGGGGEGPALSSDFESLIHAACMTLFSLKKHTWIQSYEARLPFLLFVIVTFVTIP